MTQGKIKVAVSPFYQGFGWHDKALNQDFKPQPRLVPIVISEDKDLTEVSNRVRLNHLLLLEGTLPEINKAKDPQDTIAEQANEIKALKKELAELKATEPKAEEEPVEEEIEPQSNFDSEEVYTQEELEALRVADLKKILDEREAEYSTSAKKDDLIELLVGQIK